MRAPRVVAKTFCFDFLSIVLALGSGVVFGGVLQGALLSTVCATIASGLGFQLARTKLRSQVAEQVILDFLGGERVPL